MNDQDRIDFWIDAERCLSSVDLKILRLLCDGYNYKEVSEMAGMTTGKVDYRIKKIRSHNRLKDCM